MKTTCFFGYRCLAFLALVMLVGCSKSINPIVAEAQTRFLASEIAGDPFSLATANENFTEGMHVTVAGRIYASSSSPFDPRVASFAIIELPEPGHNHDDPNDCPFCKRKAELAASAIVQLCSSDGQPINMPANKLLGLENNQDVVISGSCTQVGEILIINADRLRVLEPDKAIEIAAGFNSELKNK